MAEVFDVARGNNPLVPHLYHADPEPFVGPDGTVTLFCSFDVSTAFYCSDVYRFMTSDDLKTWTDRGVSLRLSDLPPGSGSLLYACDCVHRDGTWYLYVSTDNGTLAVATSDSPTGPFGHARHVRGLGERPGIDPAVFVDDDGSAYLYWGQKDNVRAARLLPTMDAIDPASVVQPLTLREHFFHEGSAMTRRDGLYYYVYADESRNATPSCIGYATAPTPLGPFTYRGVIIDNLHCDPKVWNNHGRILAFRGQWYVFYHRATHGAVSMRQSCAEPIAFTPDGLIPEVRMTSKGIGDAIDLTKPTPAYLACQLGGVARFEKQDDDGLLALAQIHPGDGATFRGVRFGSAATRLAVEVNVPGDGNAVGSGAVGSGAIGGGAIEVRIGDASGDPLAVLELSGTAGGGRTLATPLRGAVPMTGEHDLLLRFRDVPAGTRLRSLQFAG
jgi:hypothetical protein